MKQNQHMSELNFVLFIKKMWNLFLKNKKKIFFVGFDF